jgi:hypothetical protein
VDPQTLPLTQGARIRISNPHRGAVAAIVEHIGPPNDLPEIPGAPSADVVRAIFADAGVGQVALLSHDHAGERVCFCAIQFEDGAWSDLQGQPLAIEAL